MATVGLSHLLEAHKDPEWNVRKMAAMSMGYVAVAAPDMMDQCLPLLVTALADEQPKVSAAASGALAEIV